MEIFNCLHVEPGPVKGCPGCEECAKCEDCGTTVSGVFEPCPYAEEIQGDKTLVWLCRACAGIRAQDV